jgi:hypothetical protein
MVMLEKNHKAHTESDDELQVLGSKLLTLLGYAELIDHTSDTYSLDGEPMLAQDFPKLCNHPGVKERLVDIAETIFEANPSIKVGDDIDFDDAMETGREFIEKFLGDIIMRLRLAEQATAIVHG